MNYVRTGELVMIIRTFIPKKYLLDKIDRLYAEKAELQNKVDKLQSGTLDKNIINDYENRIGALKTENYFLKNEVDHLKFYEQVIDEQDVDDIQQLIKVLAVKSMFKGE